jgi:hypothetical protein
MSASTLPTHQPHGKPRAVALACSLFAIAVPACSHWATQDLPTPQVVESRHPDRIRVTRRDGRLIVFLAPRIAGDSLVGTAEDPTTGVRTAQYGIPLADVREVAVRRLNVGATIALAAGVGLTAAVVAAAASGSSSSTQSGGGSGSGGSYCDYCYSCPLVYSWDGAHWRLDSGTFGGAIVRALQRTDVDNLDAAKAERGVLRLDARNELSETDFIDRLALVAVDHDTGTSVAPDAEGRLHGLGRLLEPIRATDLKGRDVLARVRETDQWRWESVPRRRNPADTAELRDGIEVVFPRPAGTGLVRLVLDAQNTPWAAYLLGEFVRAHGAATGAWYDSLDASPAQARRLGTLLAAQAFLRAEVATPAGWRPIGLFWEAGPEIVKRQVLAFDASGLPGDTIRVRLESAPSFWLIDRVGLDVGPEPTFREQELALISARDRAGRDVRPQLAAIDGRYLTVEPGDGAELRFRDPPATTGRRSYLLRSTGWYRLHTPAGDRGNPALLARVAGDPWGVSRASVAAMNDALATMASGSW